MSRTAFVFACSIIGAAVAQQARATLVITSAPGYSITWDGNEGDFFSGSSPANVPVNLARADQGGAAFADSNSSLGVEASLSIHFIADLNDGIYGNSDSWISNTASPHFAGVAFNGSQSIASVAWGRDNGRDAASGDCCGGQLTDRWSGVYTLQFTTVLDPDETTPDSSWTTIGTLDYQSADDTVIGGSFTPWYRHRYDLSGPSGSITATGIRIIVPGGGFDSTSGTGIDEIEVFAALPEPTGVVLLSVAGVALAARRGRIPRDE